MATCAILMLSLPAATFAASVTTSMNMNMSSSTTPFTDVSTSNQYYTAIMALKADGIISGYPDGTFKPDQVVNRVEALKIILNGASITVPVASGNAGFSDTIATEWYAQYLLKAKSLNIVSGYPDGTFKPNQTVTLAENLKMLINAKGISLSNVSVTSNPFADAFKDQWYAKYVEYAKEQKWITADANNMIYPAQGMTRGKLALLIYNSMNTNQSVAPSNTPTQQQTQQTNNQPATSPTGAPPLVGLNVSISNFTFIKNSMTIAQGTTVTWTNNDSVAHTVTADDGSFNSGNINPGQSFSYTFNTNGTFTYHCSIHTTMTGTIIVKPAIEVPTI